MNDDWFDKLFGASIVIVFGSMAFASLVGATMLALYLAGLMAWPCG